MSENRILQPPPPLSPTYLVYGLPKAAAWLIRMLFAAVAAGLMYLTVRGITHHGSVYMIAFVGILAGVFCLVVLHPRSGRAVTYFLGDRHGMYFPASASHTLFSAPQADSWLHVPWQNISRIQSVKFNDTEYVAFSVAATADEESKYFGTAAQAKRLLGKNTDPEGRLIVAYANAFAASAKVVAALQEFKRGSEAGAR